MLEEENWNSFNYLSFKYFKTVLSCLKYFKRKCNFFLIRNS